MAEMILNCPHCQQPIQCDDQWAGQQIQCPLCQGALVVPQGASAPGQAPAAPTPPVDYGKQLVAAPSGNKLSMQHNAQTPATPRQNIPIRNLVDTGAGRKKKSPIIGYAIGAVVFVACAAGGYFGYTKYQEHVEAKKAEEARQAEEAAKAAKQREAATAAAANPVPANGPMTPPAYTLDVTAAKIPQCAVNGSISGSNFVAEVIRLDPAAGGPVLRLTQGQMNQPDREFLIYLGLKPGDKLSGHTWSISSDMKGAEVPKIYKRWKVKAGYAPVMKPYVNGYAMQLELGQVANGAVPGKIFIALPDQEQSVAGGLFQAQTTLPDVVGAPPVPPPGAMPMPTAAPRPGGTDRYGRTR